jgi:hypothetical protein
VGIPISDEAFFLKGVVQVTVRHAHQSLTSGEQIDEEQVDVAVARLVSWFLADVDFALTAKRSPIQTVSQNLNQAIFSWRRCLWLLSLHNIEFFVIVHLIVVSFSLVFLFAVKEIGFSNC